MSNMDEIFEIELGNRRSGTRGKVGKLFDYFRNGHPNDFQAFLSDLAAVEGGTISSSEAASLLGCSRQRIHQLIRSGRVHAWVFHGGYLRDVTLWLELSVLDLLNYADSIGRPIEYLHASTHVKVLPAIEKYYKQRSDQARMLANKHRMGEASTGQILRGDTPVAETGVVRPEITA
jgi:hypothetical protein